MIRPADQAKLLFLYLLRSSAALATRNGAAGSRLAAVASQSTAPPAAAATTSVPVLDGHIALRLARRADVPMIQRCNLATLPENYSAQFYANHMRQWPELALVAEHVPERCAGGGGGGSRFASTTLARYGNLSSSGAGDDGRRIVGYVLGKVEGGAPITGSRNSNAPAALPRSALPRSTVLDADDERGLLDAMASSLRQQQSPETENLGHVTSLAILHDYRRRGLAAQLMDQLHFHMKEVYNANAVGLHVRVSNGAATRLYRDGMGYDVADVIQSYYQDGEDAYFMRKDFPRIRGDVNGDSSNAAAADDVGGRLGVTGRVRRSLSSFSFRSRRPWEAAPEDLRLPRFIFLNDSLEAGSTCDDEEEMAEEEKQEQVMSGTM